MLDKVTPQELADGIHAVREWLMGHRWIKGSLFHVGDKAYDPSVTSAAMRREWYRENATGACLLGAMEVVLGKDSQYTPVQHRMRVAVQEAIDEHGSAHGGCAVGLFNDAEATTFQDVIDVLDLAEKNVRKEVS